MEYLDRRVGRFVTVLPRSRMEDRAFREWIQENEPDWEKVWDRPNPRRKGGPRDRWYVWPYHLPSGEGWPPGTGRPARTGDPLRPQDQEEVGDHLITG